MRPQRRERFLRDTRGAAAALALLGVLFQGASGQVLRNEATGTSASRPLDTTQGASTLRRASSIAASAMAEVTPAMVFAGERVELSYTMVAALGPADAGVRTVEITVPSAFTDVVVTEVSVGGTPLSQACPFPAAGEYCASAVDSVVVVQLGARWQQSGAPIGVRIAATAPPTPATHSLPSRLTDGSLSMAASPGNADGVLGNSDDVLVRTVVPQGIVLDLEIVPDRAQVVLGEALTVNVPIRNRTDADVVDARIDVEVPPHWKPVSGHFLLDGAPLAVPSASASRLHLPLGTVPGRVDTNGNGTADPGEVGYRLMTFRLTPTSAARPGAQLLRAVATDYCDSCWISSAADAPIRVTEDPDFERGTVVGKVFEDGNENGMQDLGEPGVAYSRVVLDDGTLATTDADGRYHFPFVSPGQRLVKIDLASVGASARATTDSSRIVRVTPGLLVKASFGVVMDTEEVEIGREAVEGIALVSLAEDHGIDVLGNVRGMSLLVNGVDMPSPRVELRADRAETGLRLGVTAEREEEAISWAIEVRDASGAVLRRIEARGQPPRSVGWDGALGPDAPAGAVPAYAQARVRYGDGAEVTSARRWLDPGARTTAVPRASVHGAAVEVDELGRFARKVADPHTDTLRVSLEGPDGRGLQRSVPVPAFEIHEPRSVRVLREGAVATPGLLGWTDGRNAVEVDGASVDLGERGAIVVPVDENSTRATHTVLIRNPAGLTRIVNLNVDRQERDDGGERWVLREGVPRMTLRVPPAGVVLPGPLLRLSGETEPGNQVTANGSSLRVEPDGRFAGIAELHPGKNLLVVEVHDAAGQTGTIEREVHVAERGLFLLAFADLEAGWREGEGRIEAADMEESSELYHQGRIAYYLEGRIRGRYLITSALDTGRGELDELFSDLGPDEADELLRNLDPDRLYPVYGDASETVYGAQSAGKLYLAIEAEEGRAVFGNGRVQFDDTELATYRRTLYGGFLDYESVGHTPDGAPVFRLSAFAADVNRIHVRNELRATGGSLYYLSHRDLVEGSEQVSLVVRDERTGLLLGRTVQSEGRDYTVKYPEGRILFRRPIQSVDPGGAPVDEELLSGHPVFVEVDFEARRADFAETAFGARAAGRLGPVGVGATHVDDPQAAGSYELSGVDASVRIGKNARILGELAESSGAGARTYRSDDGGVSFAEVSAADRADGEAWKVAAELARGPVRASVYHKDLGDGFSSGLGSFERGTTKSGGQVRVQLGTSHFRVRHHREELAGTSQLTTALWKLETERFGVATEVERREADGAASTIAPDRTLASAEASARLSARVTAALGRQQTLEGPKNDRTILRLGWRVLERVAMDAEGTQGTRGKSLQAGAAVELLGGRLYVTERLRDEDPRRRRTTVVGAEGDLTGTTRLYSEYQWDRGDGGESAISLVGARQTWEARTGLRLVVGAELAESDGPSGKRERSSASAGVTWMRKDGVTASSRNEVRYESGAGQPPRRQLLTVNRVDVLLTPDLAVLGKYRYSRTDDRTDGSTEARLDEASVGLAYRPVRHDRLNGLARYTRLVDQRPAGEGGAERPEALTDVVSLEGAVDVTPRLQWYTKGAVRVHVERESALPEIRSRTWLGIQRVDLTVRRPVDLGLEYRMLRQTEADDMLQGWLGEVSGKVRTRLRVGLGYNFTDFSDDEFTMNDHSVRGWFVRLQGRY